MAVKFENLCGIDKSLEIHNLSKLIQEEIAQIQNIITREMKTAIENIHIMKK